MWFIKLILNAKNKIGVNFSYNILFVFLLFGALFPFFFSSFLFFLNSFAYYKALYNPFDSLKP